MREVISQIDLRHYQKIRKNVSRFLEHSSKEYDGTGVMLLDIAPQHHEGARAYFSQATIETLDLDPSSGATYIADLCQNNNSQIPTGRFDVIVCTEVLEHTREPFRAVKELRRMLKRGGVALVSTPYDFRIHGPLPDCWRFTEHGLRELFSTFSVQSLEPLLNRNRWLMPIQYVLVARKP